MKIAERDRFKSAESSTNKEFLLAVVISVVFSGFFLIVCVK